MSMKRTCATSSWICSLTSAGMLSSTARVVPALAPRT